MKILYYKSVERIKFVDAERLSGEDTLVIADEKYTGKDIEDFKFKVTENEDGDYVLKANGNYVYVINGNLVYGTDAKEAESICNRSNFCSYSQRRHRNI